MQKAILIERVARNVGITEKKAKEVVEAMFGAIKGAVAQGEPVEFRGFGRFSARDLPSRRAHCPRNGEFIQTRAKKRPWFKAGKGLREAVNGV